ncbi:hypothetical protein [Bradyrhizobium sp. ORS 111]|uniref:hypothetical protein n=1 Tax=Bradyrhizobium sp. ORS 111 TaxID=1685958 RepID=UPI0038903E16
MKPLIIIVIAAAGLLAAATGIPRPNSGSTIGHAGPANTSTLHDMQSTLGGKLQAEDFDDRSLVFPRDSKR